MDWLTNHLSITLGALIVWGFLMAFLFNVMMIFIKETKDSLLIFTSFFMFTSYFTSDHFNSVLSQLDIFLIWFIYDVVTLAIIVAFALYLKSKSSIGVKYIYIGLIFNSALFLAMHLDTFVYGNKERWWLWDLYSAGVNLVDFMMIVALIVDKDFLGILRAYRYVTKPVRSIGKGLGKI